MLRSESSLRVKELHDAQVGNGRYVVELIFEAVALNKSEMTSVFNVLAEEILVWVFYAQLACLFTIQIQGDQGDLANFF